MFQNDISQHEMYPEDDRIVQRLLRRIVTSPFLSLCKYENYGSF